MSDEKYAFKMQLNPGMADEYRARHYAIRPELSAALRAAGVRDYSIHLDRETSILFAVMWRRHDHTLDDLARTDIMRNWWDHMGDIMQTHPDGEPETSALECLFHLE
jgi:L-rhamnose mutarotase